MDRNIPKSSAPCRNEIDKGGRAGSDQQTRDRHKRHEITAAIKCATPPNQ